MSEEFFDDEKSMQFFQLVYMLQRSSMMHMGMLPDGEGRVHFNLAETKAAIDTLVMIKAKTQGNLSDKELTMDSKGRIQNFTVFGHFYFSIIFDKYHLWSLLAILHRGGTLPDILIRQYTLKTSFLHSFKILRSGVIIARTQNAPRFPSRASIFISRTGST